MILGKGGRNGGEIILVKQLHNKLYLVDRKDAIVASSNLAQGGIEGNIEAGILSNNPVMLREITISFVLCTWRQRSEAIAVQTVPIGKIIVPLILIYWPNGSVWERR